MKKNVLAICLIMVASIGHAQITDNGTLSLSHDSSTVGDMVSLYGNRLNQPFMYGFGVANSSLYYKSVLKHLWYIGTNYDNGTSPLMELNTSGLTIKPKIESSSTLSLSHNQSIIGDIVSLYGNRINQPLMYGFGVADYSLYYKSAQKHLWYIGTNYDNGVSAIMKLEGALLTLDGRIRTEEIKVEIINGPDYVFEPDYPLKTLKETKEYILAHKHLPEIPSAKEMENNGVDLGDMNMRLLKKIEELTLYQIELLERLEMAESKIEKLEKK